MPKVIVTVVDANNKGNRDFEIPSEMTVKNMAAQFAEVFKEAPDATYRVEAQPLGRTLNDNENLEQAGVWDGSLLVLYQIAKKEEPVHDAGPVQAAQPVPATEQSQAARASGTPLLGWKALELAKPKEQGKKRQSKGFAWKQLD